MAVYDVNGNEIVALYDVDGNELFSAYDIDGEEVYTGEKYSIENVVSYFRPETLSVAEDINELSTDWQSFVFITDTHGSGNKNHSQAIGLYLLDNTPVSMIVLGGDYSYYNWSKSEYDNYMSPFVESKYAGKIYAVMGNHERFGGGASEAKQSIYNDFLKNKSNIHGLLSENYYYFDDVPYKTRYMFLNTSDSGDYTTSQTQIAWIAQNVVLPGSDWSIVVIGHVNIANILGVMDGTESNGAAVITAIQQCNGSVVGYICGHQHVDAMEKIENIQHVTLMVDKFENTNWINGYSITNRVEGTTDEQAVSVISINTKTKDVVIRRIGSGRSRTLNYSYASD